MDFFTHWPTSNVSRRGAKLLLVNLDIFFVNLIICGGTYIPTQHQFNILHFHSDHTFQLGFIQITVVISIDFWTIAFALKNFHCCQIFTYKVEWFHIIWNQAKQGGRGCCCCLFQTNNKQKQYKFQQFHLEPDHARGDGLDQELADSWNGIVFHLKKVGQSLKVETSKLFLPFAQPQWENCFLKEDFVPENKLKSKLFIQMKKSLPRLFLHCSHCQYFHLRPEFIF